MLITYFKNSSSIVSTILDIIVILIFSLMVFSNVIKFK